MLISTASDVDGWVCDSLPAVSWDHSHVTVKHAAETEFETFLQLTGRQGGKVMTRIIFPVFLPDDLKKVAGSEQGREHILCVHHCCFAQK